MEEAAQEDEAEGTMGGTKRPTGPAMGGVGMHGGAVRRAEMGDDGVAAEAAVEAGGTPNLAVTKRPRVSVKHNQPPRKAQWQQQATRTRGYATPNVAKAEVITSYEATPFGTNARSGCVCYKRNGTSSGSACKGAMRQQR
eukprot:GHVU01001190.1.p3 GENE.GHVU01001190.1~~GHVU01001190.1.p3  ORF type:complete len:158 (+),score=25.36 GHVU01001190.1:55-474(+)